MIVDIERVVRGLYVEVREAGVLGGSLGTDGLGSGPPRAPLQKPATTEMEQRIQGNGLDIQFTRIMN